MIHQLTTGGKDATAIRPALRCE